MPVFKLNFFLIFFWALLCYFLHVKEKKKNLVFLGIIFIQFTFLAWQRDFYVGKDTYQYFTAGFNYFSKQNFVGIFLGGWEPGYNLWNWIVFKLGGNFHTFLLLTGGFIYYSFLRFTYRYSSNVYISVLIYVAFSFFSGSLHILRQYMALSIIFFSYDYILKRRLISFVSLVIIASLFHSSAIFFIPTYFIVTKIRKIQNLPSICVFILSFLIAIFIGKLLISLFLFSDKFGERYLDDGSEGSGYNMLLLMSAFMGFGLLVKPKYMNFNVKMFYLIYFMAVCLQPFATIISMVSRGILYWSGSITIFLPMVISQIKSKNIRLLAYSLILAFLIIYFLKITNANEGIDAWATYRWYNGD